MNTLKLIALASLVAPTLALAQMTPVGKWHGIDDETKKPNAEFRLFEKNGAVFGVIEKSLTPPKAGDEPNCSKCTDDRKDKPKVGIELIRDAKPNAAKDAWEGGTILDPNAGKTYKLVMTPIEGGKKLQVRGYIGLFYRTQIWTRVE